MQENLITKKRAKVTHGFIIFNNHYFLFCAFVFSLLIFKQNFKYVLS